MTPDATNTQSRDPNDSLVHAGLAMARHPQRNLFSIWSWKTAAMSALFRAAIFLFTNRHAGFWPDVGSGVVEAVFAIFASGLIGAMTQRLRNTRPLWATAFSVWLLLPALMTAAQLEVHRLGHTENLREGIIGSFLFASIASGFTWFAMRRGTLLAGPGGDPFLQDLRAMPHILGEFLVWPVRRSKPIL